ncbi:hypothetical protein [Leisingera sp. ANG-Vp]|uniref:hypothetical protein n=1 Tax=Leisingera sp. ANG-Vp TaxID=1577896 RepID=UPI00057D3B9E|nr:hypothetical protein [Leisingera sp. ANG-Vp]KIC13397.1 hypothetical protein RA20_23985 [Leisingera sp. ANG-Vp]
MSLPATDIDPLAGQLEHVLGAGRLPREYSNWGSQLLKRLRQPVRVALTGTAGAGKSAVADMLLGRVVIGRKAGGHMVEICHGRDERVVFEAADGTRVQQPGVLADAEVPQDAVLVRQYLPDPQLRWHSYTELPLSGSAGRQRDLLQKASAAVDIILWCSQEFGAAEQALWAGVPDSSKDHSFLVLTMADRQIMRGILADRIAALEPVAAEEFLGVYPVAAIQGLTARTSGGPSGAGLWRSSGGKQLFDDVMHQVELGRSSDLDQAEMLVRQYGAAAPSPEPAPRPAARKPQEPPQASAAKPAGAGQGLDAALERLQQRAEEMLAEEDAAGGPRADAVLGRCLEAVQELSEMLEQAPDSPAAETARETAQDGSELMVLCQLEQGEDAAIDAVTLLVQLKKELAEDSS